MKVILTCAGTGGHINPAIAIANVIKQNEPTSTILFIGTKNGLEQELVKKAGYNIVSIRAGKLHRKITTENVKNMTNAMLGINDAKKIMKEFKPDIVIGTGGYITLSVMKAATMQKIPYVLHESNAFPGLSVKLTAKKAKKVFVGFEDAIKRLNSKVNTIVTGTPAKFNVDTIDALDKATCKEELEYINVIGDRKIVFVTGGSQGAKYFNEVVVNMVKKYTPDKFFVIVATGMNNYDTVSTRISEEKLDKYIKAEKFIYDMEKMYKLADLLVTRAGAMTVTELAISKSAAILIPLKSAAENHQYFNAKVLENKGAAKIIIEDELDEQRLYEEISSVILDDEKLDAMRTNARKEYVPNVEQKIYNEIKEIVGR